MSDDLIGKAFGLQTMPKVKIDVPDVNDDFQHAREKLLKIIESCQTAIDALMEIAEQSQSARYYEALATHFKVMNDATRSLMDLQKSVRDIYSHEGKSPVKQTNNLFVGSSAELLELIRSKQ